MTVPPSSPASTIIIVFISAAIVYGLKRLVPSLDSGGGDLRRMEQGTSNHTHLNENAASEYNYYACWTLMVELAFWEESGPLLWQSSQHRFPSCSYGACY